MEPTRKELEERLVELTREVQQREDGKQQAAASLREKQSAKREQRNG